ncbi:cytochrome c oxidase subunit II [Azospirillum doebereinerae]|uniref:Cytochrome c oxidase subunit 2 n=2 Tax=Azospirillum doebereinerae TaxID=92933 RepID=A0A433J4K7_9PROT|nr:cytochrome c oxidase subunit II [Azospirillum doebereinerae]MCG5239748.1 cytochrome c oxidase subunit II [Azospirillum doebereinerae]RUQ67140.1 cytochrome c oxidase subunit II [Azospirillum doebereinerae]
MKRQSLWAAGLAVVMSTAGAGTALANEPHPWQIGLQEPASPVKHLMDSFHSLLTVIITLIVIFVAALLAYCVVRFNAKKNPVPSKTSHHTLLEVAWTVLPVIILIVVAVPSFKLLYVAERVPQADMTIKVTGRQWYWDYEYPDHDNIAFSSNLIQESDLKPGQRRLLEVDNRVVVPVNATVRLLVTAGDVIHSWAIPSFGVKKDGVPGRINETWFKAEREGVYYGQCSEICGVNHGYMPIAVEVMSKPNFDAWVAKTKTAQGIGDRSRDVAQAPAPAAGAVQ